MPQLDQASRTPTSTRFAPYLPQAGKLDREIVVEAEDELIVDVRCSLRPAQLVEDKLARILKDSMVPVSHLQLRSLLRAR